MSIIEQYENQLKIYKEMLKFLENQEYINIIKKDIKKYQDKINNLKDNDKFMSIFKRES